MARPRRDPTQVTAQPALTTSTGRRWLVWGGVLAAVTLAILVTLAVTREPAAWAACALIAALYLTMVVVRFAVPSSRMRLVLLACLMGTIAVTAVVSLVLVGALSAGGG